MYEWREKMLKKFIESFDPLGKEFENGKILRMQKDEIQDVFVYFPQEFYYGGAN